jgi:hypothetical protein
MPTFIHIHDFYAFKTFADSVHYIKLRISDAVTEKLDEIAPWKLDLLKKTPPPHE